METVQIRTFGSADLDAVCRLWWDTSLDPRQVAIAKQLLADQLFLVAQQSEEVVAFIIAGYDGVDGSIASMAVDPRFRRQGIGRQLVRQVEETLRRRGCRQMRLRVPESRSDYAVFLERLHYGAGPDGSFGKQIAAGEDEYEVAPTIPVDAAISLTAMRDEDKPALVREFNALGDAAGYLSRVPFPYTPFDADFWLASCKVQSTAADALPQWKMRSWAIRDAQERMIGGIGLCNLSPGEKAEIGYWLAIDRWGQGIMTKVVERLTEFAFREYRLQKIYAEVVTTNLGSRRVLEKAGYELEGIFRHHSFRAGQPVDAAMYGRLPPSLAE